ncbi:FAD-binding oxidoreductase [Thermogemmatispora tikiterensis]|uniref:Oxidoreductase n=1 Tax=Thermogemmatispora tikiterensis TaxID=1825093 RepID=A0A328VLH4_9CHLR|nr:FAD-binding oxidoreductase [Thermogemmatispora tikiterensis]RAQ98029.1 oxidoreductase [Thermogemmatispora tikiterensis]
MAIEERSSAINASALQANLRGQVIQPGEAAYEATRRVYNAMIDKRPALIVRCADVADVITAVNFARDHGLPLSIRSGGHNASGLGICDDGLVIDLSLLRYTHVDPDRHTARVGAGCTWGDVDHATHAFGLAVPAGIISTTGVGGLTLGGGLGHLTRSYGLTIDNLLEATVVLADGSVVVTSEQQQPDLFWALRGGGGNFGVVTSFLFRTQPVDTVYAGPMLWELEKAPEILRWYQNLITTAPEDLNGFFAFLTVPPGPPFPEHLHNKKLCGVVWCYTGPLDRAEQTFQPIRQFRQPALDLVGPLPFPALQSMFDALYPPGLQWYWKADFVKELSDEAIGLHTQHGSQLPTLQSTMHLYPVNGAASHVSNNATSWSYRDATWAEVIVGVSPDPGQKETITSWARAYWTALHPYAESGAYVNFMMEGEGNERVRAAYRENYERLSQVKRHYDPANLFRINQNIQPAV